MKISGIFIAVLLLLCATTAEGAFYAEQGAKVAIPFGKSYDYSKILVTKAIDGDTLRLENGEKVRLIGIDTPESRMNAKLKRDSRRTEKDYETIVSMGKKSAEYTRSLVQGKRVRLEFDVEKHDRYNRLLAYVYLPDGRMLNAEIIGAGYAQVMTVPPNVAQQDLFLRLQQEARDNKRGFWKDAF